MSLPTIIGRLKTAFMLAQPGLSDRDAEKLARVALDILDLPSENMIRAMYATMSGVDRRTLFARPEAVWMAAVRAAKSEHTANA